MYSSGAFGNVAQVGGTGMVHWFCVILLINPITINTYLGRQLMLKRLRQKVKANCSRHDPQGRGTIQTYLYGSIEETTCRTGMDTVGPKRGRASSGWNHLMRVWIDMDQVTR